MMKISPKTQTSSSPVPNSPVWAEACIAVEMQDGSFLLDDGRLAQPAVSCLLKPIAGDKVLVAMAKQGDTYIVHLLHRPRSVSACLSVPGMKQLTIMQQQVEVNAFDGLALRALGDVEVTASTGVLRLTARNLFTTVSESLVQNVRNYIGQAEQYLLDVRQVLRLHGKQASVTAEQDVKIDAERISMG